MRNNRGYVKRETVADAMVGCSYAHPMPAWPKRNAAYAAH
jgi:hypothetical protein